MDIWSAEDQSEIQKDEIQIHKIDFIYLGMQTHTD